MTGKEIDIHYQIENSETSIDLKDEIRRQYKIAEDIIDMVKNEPEIRDRFIEEYKELQNEIISAIANDNKITREELSGIKYELSNINDLYDREISFSKIINNSINKFGYGKDLGKDDFNFVSYSNEEYEKKKNYEEIIEKLKKNKKEFKEEDIPKFLENPDLITVIDNEDFLLKLLDEAKDKKIDITLENINQNLRNNKIIIENLPGNLNYSELILIDKEFFLDEKNINTIIWKIDINSDTLKRFFLLLKNIIGEDEIINTLVKVFENDDFKKEISKSKITGIKDLILKSIHIDISKLDKENRLGIDERLKDEKFIKHANEYKQEEFDDIKNRINISFDENVKENLELLGDYIYFYGIKGLEKEILSLIKKGYFKELKSSLIYYLEDNINFAIIAIEQDSNNFSLLPLKLRGNYYVIKSLLKSNNFDKKLLKYIDIVDIKSIIMIYKWADRNGNKKDLLNIFLNDKFSPNFINIIESNYDGFTSYEMEILLKIKSIIFDISKVEDDIKEITEKSENNENYNQKIKELLGKEIGDKEKVNKIANLINFKGNFTKKIYDLIFEACDNDNEKTKDLIFKLKEINLEEIRNRQKQEIKINPNKNEKLSLFLKKNEKGEIIIDEEGEALIDYELFKKDFHKFIINNPKEKNERTMNDYRGRIISEYIKYLDMYEKRDSVENKQIIDKITLFFIEIENEVELEKRELYIKHLSGKISDEELLNLYNDSIINKVINNINEEKNEKDKILTENNKPENNEENSFNENSTYNYNKNKYVQLESGNYQIKTPNGEEIIITEDEKNLTQNNPEGMKNLINAHDLFINNLKLRSAWENRKELIESMGDQTIKINENFLDKDEIIKFLNNLIKFINNIPGRNGKKLQNSNNLGILINELKIYSGANSVLDGEKTNNTYGDDRLGKDLRDLKIIGDWGFKTHTFREIMKG